MNKSRKMQEIQPLSEEFYKKICNSYIETISDELLLEKDNKILYIWIDDEYIPLKEGGKINNQNYTNYLYDDCIPIEFNSYQELYEKDLKYDIALDIENIGLYNDNNTWDFYLTKDEFLCIKDDLLMNYSTKDRIRKFMEYINDNEQEPKEFKSLLEKASPTSKKKEYER